jgi:hypothetical protein
MHFTKFELVTQQRDERVVTLEATMAALDQSFAVWKPEVESSFSSVKLELVKINSFFDRKARATCIPQPGVLSTGSAIARSPPGSPADGPSGHHVKKITGIMDSGVYSPKFMTRSRVR